MNALVQVGDGQWITPEDIVSVQVWPMHEDTVLKRTFPPNVTIKIRDGTYVTTYWPADRVLRILGLIDRTWVHETWEKTA